MDELGKCPFCGGLPTKRVKAMGETDIFCTAEGCPAKYGVSAIGRSAAAEDWLDYCDRVIAWVEFQKARA